MSSLPSKPDAVIAGSRALQAFHRFEDALRDLEETPEAAGELATVLSISRERLVRHHVRPNASLLCQFGLRRLRRVA